MAARRFSRRPVRITSHPLAASVVAHAEPMPAVAPVIKTFRLPITIVFQGENTLSG